MEDKIRLEEELEFLKESLDSEVISQEEYDKAKKEIDEKLEKLEKPVKKEAKKKPKEKEIKVEVIKDKKEEKTSKIKKDVKIEVTELSDPDALEEPKEGVKEETKAEEEKPVMQEYFDEKEKDTKEIINDGNGQKSHKGTKKSGNNWLLGSAAVILVAIIAFFMLISNNGTTKSISEPEFTPACLSDTDCVSEGMIGTCSNAGEKEAQCEFKEESVQIEFIVLNNNNCFNCDTSRVEKIIRGWFPNIVKKEINHDSEDGKKLIKELNLEMLPSYVFNSSIEETHKFKELSGIFNKRSDKFVLSSGASGSNFYINKQEEPNKLDIYLVSDDVSTDQAERNIKEFLDIFDGKIDLNKHLVKKNDNVVKNLQINIFPTFIINNKVRFSGIQPAETIKQNFCKLNSLDECGSKLSKNLV